jgi:hypothetical protein
MDPRVLLTFLGTDAPQDESQKSDLDHRKKKIYYVTKGKEFIVKLQSNYSLSETEILVSLLYDNSEANEVLPLKDEKPLTCTVHYESSSNFTLRCRIFVLSSQKSDLDFLLHVRQIYNGCPIAEKIVGSFRSYSKTSTYNEKIGTKPKKVSGGTTSSTKKTSISPNKQLQPQQIQNNAVVVKDDDEVFRRLDEIRDMQTMILSSIYTQPQHTYTTGYVSNEHPQDPVEVLKSSILMLTAAYENLGDNRAKILREVLSDPEMSTSVDFISEISQNHTHRNQSPFVCYNPHCPNIRTEDPYISESLSYFPDDQYFSHEYYQEYNTKY